MKRLNKLMFYFAFAVLVAAMFTGCAITTTF